MPLLHGLLSVLRRLRNSSGVLHLTLTLCCVALTGSRKKAEESNLVLTLGVAANVCYKCVRSVLTQATWRLSSGSLAPPTPPLDQIRAEVQERSHLVCA